MAKQRGTGALKRGVVGDEDSIGSRRGMMAKQRGTGAVKRGVVGDEDSIGGTDDREGGDGVGGGGGVDLSFIESLMSGPAAAAASETPGAQPSRRDIAAVMSDSGSVFDDGTMVPDSTAGLRRRRGENGNRREAERPGER